MTSVTLWVAVSSGEAHDRGVDMGTVTERPKAEGWQDRVLAGADGVLHAASCCAPDAWLTDRREPWDPDADRAERTVDETPAAPPAGRVHVVGTTR